MGEGSSKGTRLTILLLTNRDSDNVGDQVIEACDIALIHTAMDNLGLPRDAYRVASHAAAIVPKEYVNSRDPALIERAERLIANADLVVFGGAPLFNYRYQVFYERTAVALELAEKHGTPVVFSAIGVEGYHEDDPKCQRLKRTLNLDVVKQITTRDDIASLSRYRENPQLVIDKVADPAVFSREVFRDCAGAPEGRAAGERKKVGLFVIRANAFKDNKVDFSKDQAAELWQGVVAELEARGYDYELLTSGHFGDEAFMDRLVRKHGLPSSKCVFGVNYPEMLAQRIASFDGIVSCRLHPSIIAYSYEVPAVGLVWNGKVSAFYDSIGHAERALEVGGIDAARVVDALERAMETGVARDGAYAESVYRTLLRGIARGLGIDDAGVVPYAGEELSARMAAYPGTSEREKTTKVNRKLRRAYGKYNDTFDDRAEVKKAYNALKKQPRRARPSAAAPTPQASTVKRAQPAPASPPKPTRPRRAVVDDGTPAFTVTEIRWRRAILELRYESSVDEALYVYRVKERRFVPFSMERDEKGAVARLNVTTAGAREMLGAGEWLIARRIPEEQLESTETLLAARPYLLARMEKDVRRHNKPLKQELGPEAFEEGFDELVDREGVRHVAKHPYDTHGIVYAPDVLDDIDRFSRLFRYGNRAYAYAVAFMARQNTEGVIYLLLDVTFFVKNRKPKERVGSRRFKQKRLFALAFRALSVVARRNGRRILFFKQNGDAPTGNMAALQRRMAERGVDRDFEIRGRYRNTMSGKQRLSAWLADLWAIARADFIFVDDYAPIFGFIELAPEVVLTQIWHAGVGFKSVGYARFGLVGSPDPYLSSHRAYTYALVGNSGLRDIYAEVFGIEPEALLATGMPRLDHFLDEGEAAAVRLELRERYPWTRQGRVLLFAPTFRGAGQRQAHYPYGDYLDMERIHDLCMETNSYFVFKMHHFVKKAPPIPEQFRNRLFDLSHEDLNELFHVADVLITDYSSCFYDFQLLRKPIVFYTPDRVVYSATRGVQRPVREMAPGVVCDDYDELDRVLRDMSYQAVTPPQDTLDRCIEHSGYASDRVIDTVLYGEDIEGVRLRPEDD